MEEEEANIRYDYIYDHIEDPKWDKQQFFEEYGIVKVFSKKIACHQNYEYQSNTFRCNLPMQHENVRGIYPSIEPCRH